MFAEYRVYEIREAGTCLVLVIYLGHASVLVFNNKQNFFVFCSRCMFLLSVVTIAA